VTNLLQSAVAAVRMAVAHGLYHSGILRLWCRMVLGRRAVVLTYHRVLPADAVPRTWSHPGIIVTRDTFDAHVRTLKRYFRVLTLPEFIAGLEAPEGFAAPSCLITFDDGWTDTCTEAWPVMQQHGVSGVVFLPVDYIGADRMFWQEELSALLYQAWERRSDASLRARCEGSCAAHGLASIMDAPADDVRLLIRLRVNALKARPLTVPRQLIAELVETLGVRGREHLPVDGFMTWDDVRRMHQGGIAFGGHGTTHRRLTTIEIPEVAEEAQRSRATIAREVGSAPASFSYPNGDWNPAIAGEVEHAGYRVSFSTVRGLVSSADPRLSLRRVNIHEEATRQPPLLLARLLGVI
jgi:peptidoglycan/xylan/chitin deacetylase (PgdA/CDA1 family)